MENWIFLFLGAILAYLLDFTKPWVKSFFQRSIFSSRKKRIEALKREYRWIKRHTKDHTRLIIWMMGILFWMGVFSVSLIVIMIYSVANSRPLLPLLPFSFDAFSISTLLFTILFISATAFVHQGMFVTAQNVLFFDEFREKTIAKIRKLGGNPEDLDKEEEAQELKKQYP